MKIARQGKIIKITASTGSRHCDGISGKVLHTRMHSRLIRTQETFALSVMVLILAVAIESGIDFPMAFSALQLQRSYP